MHDEKLYGLGQRFLSELGAHRDQPLTLIPLSGGRNNQVYRLETDGQCYVLKRYFNDYQKPSRRLEAEFKFLTYCQSLGIDQVPRPLLMSCRESTALYSLIEGQSFQLGAAVAEKHIHHAMDFILSINEPILNSELGKEIGKEIGKEDGTFARHIPRARESCLTGLDHVNSVDRRLKRWSAVSNEISNWVREELGAHWDMVKDQVMSCIAFESNVCVSPSDFGFHNALFNTNDLVETTYFIDFEYAGWDSPVKLVCDFFAQPDCPIQEQFWPQVIEALTPLDHQLERRVTALMPVYRHKWALIMLNECLPSTKNRREFSISAHTEILDESTLLKQSDRAKDYFYRHCVNK